MRRIALSTFVVALLLIVPVSNALAAGEQWLRYRSARDATRFIRNLAGRTLDIEAAPPVRVTLPKLASEEPLVAKWLTPMVETGYLWLVLDQSQRGGPYNLLFVDADSDGDLSDETPVQAYWKTSRGSMFGPVKVLLPGEDGPVSYHFSLSLRVFPDDGEALRILHMTSSGWYEGNVSVGDKKYRCMLVDYNANGTFNDTSDRFFEIDRIRIGVGRSLQERFVGKYIQIDGALYTPDVSPDGAFIKFTPAADVPMGTVTLAEDVAAVSLGGRNGLLSYNVRDAAVQVPEGSYRVHQWRIERTDAKRAKWTLTGSGFPDTSVFAVSSGNRAELNVGEPLETSVAMNKRGANWFFQQSMKGRSGEAVAIQRNNQLPPAPKLRITNADRSYDRVFNFEYG